MSTAGPWPRRAAAVAAALPMDRLHPRALGELRRAASAGARVAVACSGGADSVALVLSLWAHLPQLRGRWLILHFDHRLRGRASAGDARFVAALARGLGEACRVEAWRAGARAAGETAAREARFEFFARAMRAGGARVLALGHHADDVVETMLMRLTRGSSTAGLAAPRPAHRRSDGTVRVRPLLAVPREEIQIALQAARAPWREDASNTSDLHLRNRLRRRVVPVLRAAAGRDLAEAFLESRRALEEDDEALTEWMAALAGDPAVGACDTLVGRPRALARRFVHAWLHAHGLSAHVSRAASGALIDAVTSGRPVRQSAGPARFVVFDGRVLRVEADGGVGPAGWGDGVWLAVGETLSGPDGARLEACALRLTPGLRRAILAGESSPAEVAYLATRATRFLVRARRPGDRYRPLGAPGRGLLQDLFVNRKIPRNRRDALPVVIGPRKTPVWVPGLPPAAELAVQHGTKLVVQLTYHAPGAIVPTPHQALPSRTQHHVRA